MSDKNLIEGLVAMAEPVQPRRLGGEVLALIAVATLQATGAILYFGTDVVRSVIHEAGMAAITKYVVFGAVAVAFSVLALTSLTPSVRRWAPVTAVVLLGATLLGFIGLDWTTQPTMMETLLPRFGVICLLSILSLSLPVTLLLSVFMVRGASTQLNRTAVFIGLAGGSWGAFTYALQCPHVTIWYLGTWYVGGVAAVTLATRMILPRLAKW